MMETRIPEGVTSPSKLARLLGVSRQRAHQLLNKRAHNARTTFNDALKKGKVIKLDRCARCEKKTEDLEAHHWDYREPLDVRWLCPPCHSIVHPHHPNASKELIDGESFACLRCGHRWWPLLATSPKPKACASCNSPYWQTPTSNGTAKPCQCTVCVRRTEGER